jgi:hypothetical protein
MLPLPEKGQFPQACAGIMAQDINIPVVSQYFKIAMIGRQPSIQYLIHLNTP